MGISSELTVTYQAAATVATGIRAGQAVPLNLAYPGIYTDGAGPNQVNRLHAATYTFVASTPQTINLKSLVDLNGATFTDLVKVRRLVFVVRSTTDAATLTLGAEGSANEWVSLLSAGGTLTLRASTTTNTQKFVLDAPGTTAYAVGAANRLLKLAPSAHAMDVDVILEGSS